MRFPERRQRVRIITLKNAAWFFGALFLLFLAYSLYNELRPNVQTTTVGGGVSSDVRGVPKT